MSAHNWLRGRSLFTAEMFLLLKADPDLNFGKGLRWAFGSDFSPVVICSSSSYGLLLRSELPFAK